MLLNFNIDVLLSIYITNFASFYTTIYFGYLSFLHYFFNGKKICR
jgi:hypothetical protein